MDMVDTESYFSPGYFFAGLIGYIIAALILGFVFSKAGKPVWAAFVPIYNMIVHLNIAGLSGWFFLLYFVPLANIVLAIIVAIRVGQAFARSTAFSILLLWLFSLIGYIILAFGQSTYDRNRIG
ncbi:DUF5684 domain-containing protein [Serinibacter salmoneus]|uniref:Signal peptidase I n=1 Tax=Serinibacter salmoneus TaxID=556530 RepID=A0A2A9D2Z8_9MICO|nr:DUF5684 domain-containing protein [Serinibacter salmoneus]PFG21033.1 hypothetical protein ATL40_2652 [Serinibacter salmoneus]